jgi:hypothetical protein
MRDYAVLVAILGLVVTYVVIQLACVSNGQWTCKPSLDWRAP